MLSASVAKGIKSRLNGPALTFEEKLKLCRRVLITEALKSHHGLVLYWIFQTLEKKKNASNDKKERRRKSLWDLLECVSNLKEHLCKMGGISAETFINIITPTEDNDIHKHMWDFVSICLESEYLFLILSKDSLILSKVVSVLINQFPEELVLKNNMDDILQKLPSEKEGYGGDIDGMIISLLQGLNFSNQLKQFISRTYFPHKHLKDWTMFLSLLFEVKDQKPPVSVFKKLEILKDPRVQLEVFLPRLFGSLNPKMPSSDMVRLFVFFSNILGISQLNVIQKDSLWIVSSNINSNVRSSTQKKSAFLLEMINELQEKEDKGWKCEISSEVTFLKWTQYLVKDLILEIDQYAQVIIEFIRINPIIIEPMIGNFSCALLFRRSKDFSEEFSFLFGVYAKLRLIPKLIAKILIHLSQHPEIPVESDFSIQKETKLWRALSNEFQCLLFGQCLELWKTLDYHLTENKANVLVFTDIIMDLFISNCRLVDFSIPNNVIEKVTDLLIKTSGHIDKLPRSKNTLVDFSLLLKNVRQVENLPLLTEPPNDNLQKMKWNEIHRQSFQLSTIKCEDIQLEHTSLFTPYLDSNAMKEVASKCVETHETSHIIEEDRKLQLSIVEFLETQISKILSLKRNDNPVEELNSILTTPERYPKITNSRKDVRELLKSYLQLPLEYVESSIYDRVLSFSLCLLIMSGETYSSELFKILSRCLFTQKPSNVLKDIDVTLLLIKLTPISESGQWKKTAFKLLSFYAVKGLKNQENIEQHIDELTKFFSLGVNELETSTLLLSKLSQKILSTTNKSDKIMVICKKLFESLSKSHFERVSSLDNDDEEVILLLLEGFSIAVKTNHGDKDSLSKWKDHVGKLFFYCIDNTSDSSGITIDFLTNLCTEYRIFKKTIDVGLIWNKLKKKKSFSASEELLIGALFQIPKKETTQELLSDILSMSMNNDSFDEFSANIGLWQILVKTKKVPSDIQSIRQEYIEKLLNFYHSLVIANKLSNESIIKVLELEKAIFYCDKAVIRTENEASCLITSLRVQFKTCLDNPCFFDLWDSVCEITYLALVRRSNIIITRIPIILDIIRNLVKSLLRSSEQILQKGDESQLNQLSLCTRRVERLLESFGRNKEDFTRVAPYLIADILSGFQSFKIHSEIKSNLISGLHWLFKLGDKHSTAFLASSLPPGLTEMFKDLYDDYTKNYKFAGKI